MHTALTEHNSTVARLLSEHGATAVMNKVLSPECYQLITEFEDCGCCGLTALMMCTTADTVKLLLAAGVVVHVTTYIRDTYLHAAVQHKLAVPVVCLLSMQ
jgi:hypothetical protein